MFNFCKNIIKQIPQIKKIIDEKNKYFIENKTLKNQVKTLKEAIQINVNSDWILEMLLKKGALKIHKNHIKTLILGSSHGDFAINPYFTKTNSFNLCLASQDLYYSYQLYKKTKLKNLKKIILFYSVFSPGFNLIKTSEYQRCILYKLIYKIPYKDKPSQNLFTEEYKHKEYIHQLNNKILIDKNYLGYTNHPFFTKVNNSIKNRTNIHLRENSRKINQLKYIKYIYNLSHKNKHKLIIIIPPVRQDYKQYLPKSTILFKNLFQITKNLKIKVFNYYDNNCFSNSDFWDSDHLNFNGAQKFTNNLKL